MKRTLFLFVIVSKLIFASNVDTSSFNLQSQPILKHSLEISPMMSIDGHIYCVQYSYALNRNDFLISGLAFQNQDVDNSGKTYAYSVLLGYKRYFWKGLFSEIVFWPAYNHFYEKNEKKYYNSFEVWAELRTGYEIAFNVFGVEMYVNPQLLLGKGIVQGYKPQSFKDEYKSNPYLFATPNFCFGVRF